MVKSDAAFWIKQLGLTRHPEGGWFIETYRSMESVPGSVLPERFSGNRSFCTAIYFLLEQGDFSALHRIKSDELWHFYAGGRLSIEVISPAGLHEQKILGNNPDSGESFQAVVSAGSWFGAEAVDGFSLVGCTVAPGFDFSDFEIGRCEELIHLFPQYEELIRRMTRIK
jgi:uncharacterized protein